MGNENKVNIVEKQQYIFWMKYNNQQAASTKFTLYLYISMDTDAVLYKRGGGQIA